MRLIPWREMPVPVRALFGVLALFLAIVVIHDGTPWLDAIEPVYEHIYNAVLVGSAVLCLARVAMRPGERLAWTLIGVSLALWAAGNLIWLFALSDLAEAPYPSLADAMWLAFLPLCYIGLLLLARERMPHLDSRLWLDGVIGALTTAALSAAVVFGVVLASTGGDTAAVATNLAYPLGDMVLLGTVIGAMAAARGRLDRSLLCFAAGIAVFAVADSIYLKQIAEGTYVNGAIVDIGWPAGTLLMALAAWQPAVRTRSTGDELPSIVTPITLSLASLGLLIYDHFVRTNLLALALSSAAIIAVLIRLSLTHRQSRTNLVSTRRQARTDALTGLGNRFALQRALDDALAQGDSHVLLMLDLDGFKNYNDSYGHPAGDALLTRLGTRLAAAMADHGTAFRVGGDEFCVLAHWPADEDPERLAGYAREALSEQGEGFAIGASAGCPCCKRRRVMPRRRFASPTAASTPRRTAGASRPACRAPGCSAARSASTTPSSAATPTRSRAWSSTWHAASVSTTTRSSASRSRPSSTTSARSPCRARSCTSPVRWIRTNGTSCAVTR